MKLKLITTLILALGFQLSVLGQSTGNSKSAGTEENSKAPSSTSSSFFKSSSSKKKSKKKQALTYNKLVDEQKELMEANVKKYNKIAKELEKPEYSDPMYFGHKKKPKKRPPGKKKFCKECQMRH